uniref:Macaca fascicularis brain cDNA, clone: QflA-20811 n=1 Tax=Macaca fascicularis TaxID=9541 RepID=I7GCZ3_MACFA|nr:unnamed protein product [Macaca fascicularis]
MSLELRQSQGPMYPGTSPLGNHTAAQTRLLCPTRTLLLFISIRTTQESK